MQQVHWDLHVTDFRQRILSLTMEIVSVIMNQFPYGKNASIKCLK